MREILFRGKRLSDGKMVYGESINTQYDAEGKKRVYVGALFSSYIYPLLKCVEWHEVDPATVGQYTGLTDKNGKKIFEGDIVDIGEMICTVNGQYLVVYSTANHCWALERSIVHHHHYFTFSDLNGFAESSEVIGNIHDNPDLLNKEG